MMLKQGLGRTAALALAVSSCSEQRADGETEPAPMSEPSYGQIIKLAGVYSWAFEASVLQLCDPSNGKCDPGMPNATGCWVDFSDRAYGQLSKLCDGAVFPHNGEGEIWLEGVGRVTRNPGAFGHLNAYDCQVEMRSVDVAAKLTDDPFGPPQS